MIMTKFLTTNYLSDLSYKSKIKQTTQTMVNLVFIAKNDI